MTTEGPGNEIRRTMTEKGMSEDELVEGCKQIVAEHEASERERAEKRASDQMRGYVEEARRQAQPGNTYDWVKKNSPGG